MSSDVFITGVGMVTSIGTNTFETLAAWRNEAAVNVRNIPEFKGTVFSEAMAAVLPEFDMVGRLSKPRMAKFMSYSSLLGCVAVREAISESGNGNFAPERTGLFASTGMAAAYVDESMEMFSSSLDANGNFSIRMFGEKGLKAINPLLSFKVLANMPACMVSILEDIKGPSYIFTPWEDQTGAAVIEAVASLRKGLVDRAVVVASDVPSHPASLSYLLREKYIGTDEPAAAGAGCLILERGETALGSGRFCSRLSDAALSSGSAIYDPLAKRIGRTVAAAPLIMLGLAAKGIDIPLEMGGCGGHVFTAGVRA